MSRSWPGVFVSIFFICQVYICMLGDCSGYYWSWPEIKSADPKLDKLTEEDDDLDEDR